MLEALYEIQKLLVSEMPLPKTKVRKALDKLDSLIDELEAEL